MAFHARTIDSWSYSRWSAYDECPKKAYYKFVLKMKEPGSPAMERGDAIHKEAEAYIKGEGKRLSPNLAQFADDFKRLRKAKASAEGSWTFRKDWTQTVYNDWDNAWCRVKIDAILLSKTGDSAEIVDHKTGRYKENGYELQMGLYGVTGFVVYPSVQTITAALWFLDHGKKIEVTYEREDFPRMQKEWERRVKPMLADRTFKERPGTACTWCFFSKSKSGPCKF